MLSKSEIEFLTGSKQVNPNYARKLKHSIKTKLENLKQTLHVLAQNELTREWLLEAITEISNTITKSSNTPNKNTSNLNLNSQNPSLKHENSQSLSLSSQNKENLGIIRGETPYWWTGRDLNPRPSACQADDHSTLIYRPFSGCSIFYILVFSYIFLCLL